MPDVLAALAGRQRMANLDAPQLQQVATIDSIHFLRDFLQHRGGIKPNVQDMAYDLVRTSCG